MLLAAVSNTLPQSITLVGVVVSGLSFIGLVRYGSRFLRSENIRAQLEEKNEIIKTHEQNIDALQRRLTIFEDEVRALTAQVRDASEQIANLQTKLDNSVQRYEELENYSAPKAITDLASRFDRQEAAINQLLTTLAPDGNSQN